MFLIFTTSLNDCFLYSIAMSAAGQETLLSFKRPKIPLITKLNSHHQNENYQELIILPLKVFTQQILSFFLQKLAPNKFFKPVSVSRCEKVTLLLAPQIFWVEVVFFWDFCTVNERIMWSSGLCGTDVLSHQHHQQHQQQWLSELIVCVSLYIKQTKRKS